MCAASVRVFVRDGIQGIHSPGTTSRVTGGAHMIAQPTGDARIPTSTIRGVTGLAS